MADLREKLRKNEGLLVVGVVLLIGNGAVWAFLSARQARQQLSLTQAETVIALRGKLNDILIDVVRKSDRYQHVRDSSDWRKNPKAQNELLNLGQEIELLKDDFCTIETRLASIEQRPIRPIQVDLIPPPPPRNVRIKVIPAGGDTAKLVAEWDPGLEGPNTAFTTTACREKRP